jgi:hypothetical protein
VVAVNILGQAVPDELVEAILGCQVVRFRYVKAARTAGPRLVQPHALHQSSPAKITLSGVQMTGPTSDSRAQLPGWRTFDVSLISDLEVLPDVFTPDQRYRPGSSRLRRLLVDCVDGWPAGPGSS